MELFIALAVLIGLVELKEYRQHKRMKSLATQVRALKRSIISQIEEIKSIQGQQEFYSKKLLELVLLMESAKEFSEKASGDLATIVREYELNGVPLGYQRKQPEGDYFVEGL